MSFLLWQINKVFDMLSKEQIEFTESCVLCWLASVCEDLQPNVSPKEMFMVQDPNTLLIANIASPISISNIERHEKVCVSLLNIFIQKGIKIYGLAKNIIQDHEEFPAYKKLLTDRYSDAFPIKSVIKVTITQVFPIVAPSYFLFPETSEADRVADSLKSYRVEQWINFHNIKKD